MPLLGRKIRWQLEDVSVWRDGVVKIWKGRVKVAGGRFLVYFCGLCGQRSPKSTNVVNHVRSHTGEKPFGCPHCTHLAVTKWKLHRHVLSAHRDQLPA
jgi:uncharacterized Zn-finger protein